MTNPEESQTFWCNLCSEAVAQVSNLLYRRIPFGRPSAVELVRRLEICDTAGWKPALRAFGSRLRQEVCDLSGLDGSKRLTL
jgi:hypothetical protein